MTVQIVDGYYEGVEKVQRGEWERVRWLASILITPHLKKGKKLKPQDLARFPWEGKKSEDISERDRVQAMLDRQKRKFGIDAKITLKNGEVISAT